MRNYCFTCRYFEFKGYGIKGICHKDPLDTRKVQKDLIMNCCRKGKFDYFENSQRFSESLHSQLNQELNPQLAKDIEIIIDDWVS